MRRPRLPAAWIKRVLPRSLLGRSLLMILIPLVLLQAVALEVYYGSHLNLVYRRLSGAVASEIDFTLDLMQQDWARSHRASIIELAGDKFDLRMNLEPGAVLPTGVRVHNVPGRWTTTCGPRSPNACSCRFRWIGRSTRVRC